MPPLARLLAALLLSIALPAAAADAPRQIAQLPLLPLPPGTHNDILALVRVHWRPYFETADANAFDRSALRVGRLDLNGDGRAELAVMIAKPEWEAEQGQPFVLATWTARGWLAVGWGWGDEDTVFATEESARGWLTVDTGTQLLRWDGKEYRRYGKE
ncbi:hypothetical protein [Magnetospirillum sp. UT-4]|uniref:hypothetical protein n=1 Tax=Magnetospirillum sp. UT-4 TaxID=2681467 RepID=UPI0013833E1D|nr:hypothetical protein [Magnetospirillum sp. UT-4]CAA7627136.1 conserved exported hypothetical protein [Magnetospirillum sp. UT-4]